MDGKVSARSLLKMAGWGIFSQGNSILCLYSVGAAIRVYILWPNTKYRVNKATPKSTPKLAGKCSLLMPKSEGHKEWLIQRPPVFKSILNWPDFCVYVHTRLMSQSSQISGGFSRHMCLTQLDSACQPSVAGNMSIHLKVSLLLRCLSWGWVKIKHVPSSQ